METALPGSSSGKSLARSAILAAVRLLGSSDFADAIVDLTGMSRKTVKNLAREAATQLEDRSPHEYREVARGESRTAAEALLTGAFKRARPSELPENALIGPDALLAIVIDNEAASELSQWSEDERGYFNALAMAVAELTCAWYREARVRVPLRWQGASADCSQIRQKVSPR